MMLTLVPAPGRGDSGMVSGIGNISVTGLSASTEISFGLFHAHANRLLYSTGPSEIAHSLDQGNVQRGSLTEDHEISVACHHVIFKNHRCAQPAGEQTLDRKERFRRRV